MKAQLERSASELAELRAQVGAWLKAMREQRGLSQRQIAILIGTDYYPMISAIEHGRGRIPTDDYEAWAAALGIPAREFVKTLMQYYDPETYRLLFSAQAG